MTAGMGSQRSRRDFARRKVPKPKKREGLQVEPRMSEKEVVALCRVGSSPAARVREIVDELPGFLGNFRGFSEDAARHGASFLDDLLRRVRKAGGSFSGSKRPGDLCLSGGIAPMKNESPKQHRHYDNQFQQ